MSSQESNPFYQLFELVDSTLTKINEENDNEESTIGVFLEIWSSFKQSLNHLDLSNNDAAWVDENSEYDTVATDMLEILILIYEKCMISRITAICGTGNMCSDYQPL